LQVLGRDDAILTTSTRAVRLSQRHAELMLLMSAHPAGLSTEKMSALLSERESRPVTIRAEMSRLRQRVPEGFFTSRPYRINVDLASDVEDVRSRLRRGALSRALAVYPGPVLPSSTAPGIVELREDLRAELRRALLETSRVDLLLAYAQTPDGRDDNELWERCLVLLPPRSSRRTTVAARLQRLDDADRAGLDDADRAGWTRGFWPPQHRRATLLQRPAR
jgi:hypothetical protein